MEQRWRKPDGFLTRKREDSVEVVARRLAHETPGPRLMLIPDPPGTFRFGDFELDAGAYELRRNGRPVRIERQPMDLLLLLVERRRQLVQRSEIIDRLWGKDVFVDVETGVHTAIRKIRRALHDSPDAPIFVETVPGKGYRFIATVEVVGAALPGHGPATGGVCHWPKRSPGLSRHGPPGIEHWPAACCISVDAHRAREWQLPWHLPRECA